MSRLMLCRLLAGKSIANGGLARTCNQAASLVQSNYSLANNERRVFASPDIVGQQNTLCVRGMYTENSLRLDSLDTLRNVKKRLFVSDRDRYMERVKRYVEASESASIVKEDLINIIGLAENEEHLDLIEQIILSPGMLTNLKNGPWGSLIMRLYYRMNNFTRAYNNIKDTERFGEFFMQYAAVRVLMTMLYKNDQYEKLLEIYNFVKGKFLVNNGLRQRQLDLLALAACVKINTPESFSIAESIYQESAALECRHLSSRLLSLYVYMMINMNEPAKALNQLTGSRLRIDLYLASASLKILALIQMNRHEDIVLHLRETLQEFSMLYKQGRKILHRDVVDLLHEKKSEIGDESVRQELMDILVELQDNNWVDDRSLEDFVFKEINTNETRASRTDDTRRSPEMNDTSQLPEMYDDRQSSGVYNDRRSSRMDDTRRSSKVGDTRRSSRLDNTRRSPRMSSGDRHSEDGDRSERLRQFDYSREADERFYK